MTSEWRACDNRTWKEKRFQQKKEAGFHRIGKHSR